MNKSTSVRKSTDWSFADCLFPTQQFSGIFFSALLLSIELQGFFFHSLHSHNRLIFISRILLVARDHMHTYRWFSIWFTNTNFEWMAIERVDPSESSNQKKIVFYSILSQMKNWYNPNPSFNMYILNILIVKRLNARTQARSEAIIILTMLIYIKYKNNNRIDNESTREKNGSMKI